MELTDAMLNHVFKQLDALDLGKKIKISDVAPNSPEFWIECAKVYQDLYSTLQFKSGYQEVKKVKKPLGFHDLIEEGAWNPKTKKAQSPELLSDKIAD